MKNAEKTRMREWIKSLQPALRKAVHAACRKYLSKADKELIKDFCTEITLRLMKDDYRRLQSFAEQSSQETWLYKIARNHVINYVKRQKPADSLGEHRTHEFQVPASQEKGALLHERQELLEWALQELTARDRELYDLFFRQELKPEDISRRTGITLAQVPKRKNKLTNKLKQLLEGKG